MASLAAKNEDARRSISDNYDLIQRLIDSIQLKHHQEQNDHDHHQNLEIETEISEFDAIEMDNYNDSCLVE